MLAAAPSDKSRTGNNQNQNKRTKYMNEPCEHLKSLTESNFTPPRVPVGCEECLKEGTLWVALRQCMACGHAATRRPANMRPNITTRPSIQ